MARSATAKATAAAEAVEAFLRGLPWVEADAAATCTPDTNPGETVVAKHPGLETGIIDGDDGSPRGPSCSVTGVGRPPTFQLTHTDWLHHRLTVSGPSEAVAVFRATACGAGTIPWQLDPASLEENWFHRLVDPAHRSLSLPGARVLAAQLREAVERRHILAVSRVGHSRACPFDLHALAPVPPDILALGPDHPGALLWLWQHWGTTQALRRVMTDTAAEARRGQVASAPGWQLQFWSADWTPWRAVTRIRTDWPTLRFDVQPSYD